MVKLIEMDERVSLRTQMQEESGAPVVVCSQYFRAVYYQQIGFQCWNGLTECYNGHLCWICCLH